MANEFQHKDPGSALTQAEYITTDGTGHIFDCQATGDILYASSATVLKNLGKGAANTVLSMGGSCIPAWTASPSVTDLTIGGGCITLSAATDIDLLDNNASALSFDSTGKAGIIDIVTTDCSEGVTMSGTLGVTGLLTAGSLDVDDVLISGTTIGHTCDTDLMTVADASLTIKGAVTVGVCATGHDVKFFGCLAGAYMLYDESEEQLEIRGAAADATTSTGKLLLTTALTDINANDVIGSINFQAPLEAGGTDAITIAAGIRAVAQATFTCAVNATDLIFYTGHSEAATEKFRFTSQGEIGIGGANYGSDGQVLTSAGTNNPAAWEDAAGGPCQAVQGELEGRCNLDKYAPPDLMQHHPGVAKAYLSFDQCGCHDIVAGAYNVTCITDGGQTGDTDITWATDFDDANYTLLGTGQPSRFVAHCPCGKLAATAIILNYTDGGALNDATDVLVAAFGKQV